MSTGPPRSPTTGTTSLSAVDGISPDDIIIGGGGPSQAASRNANDTSEKLIGKMR
jgi:hypothetical protein